MDVDVDVNEDVDVDVDVDVDMRRFVSLLSKEDRIGLNLTDMYHSRESHNIRISVKLLISEFRGILQNSIKNYTEERK
jgi:hypothetical protein